VYEVALLDPFVGWELRSNTHPRQTHTASVIRAKTRMRVFDNGVCFSSSFDFTAVGTLEDQSQQIQVSLRNGELRIFPQTLTSQYRCQVGGVLV
jgi:hypothetical protein